ncbi:putative methyltransferase [Nymphaea thermarum]|nr:putative methyltransferase [Nymphaea thermarum]
MDSRGRYTFKPALRWNPRVEEYLAGAYGSDHFARISDALTRPSCYSCVRVNTLRSRCESVIESLTLLLQRTGAAQNSDHGNGKEAAGKVGVKENCEAVGKQMQSRLLLGSCGDRVTDCTSSGMSYIYQCTVPGLENVVIVEGSGPHEIDYGVEDGRPPKEVVVSRKCAEAVLRGAHVYVPGVMACSSHVEKGDAVAVSVAVEQHIPGSGFGVGMTRGTVLQGLTTDPYYDERYGLYIGQGVAFMSRAGIFRAAEGVAVDVTNRVFQLPSFYDVLEGDIFLQNLPSIVTARVLDPQQGEQILDMCAAPGGKTTAIGILMKDKGELVAVDRSHNKVQEIRNLAAEMGLTCITAYKLDALKAVCRTQTSVDHETADSRVPELGAEGKNIDEQQRIDMGLTCNEAESKTGTYTSKAEARKHLRRLRNGPGRNHCKGGRVEVSKGFSPNSFDRVLLDAPCSALGLRPRLFAGEETLESLRNHGKYQRRMFDQAVQLVRPGGVIVYSTCTINPGENETVVRYALDTYKFLSLMPQDPYIGGPGIVGRSELLDGEHLEEWLRPGEETLVQRFDPSSPLDTIGFFIAKFHVGQKEDLTTIL